MKEETRGYVETGIDILLDVEIVEATRWLTEEIPHTSLKDLAVGYVVGAAFFKGQSMALAMQGNITNEDKAQIVTIVKRRLPEILQKIERELHR